MKIKVERKEMRTKATLDFLSSKTKLLGGCGVELHCENVLWGGWGGGGEGGELLPSFLRNLVIETFP